MDKYDYINKVTDILKEARNNLDITDFNEMLCGIDEVTNDLFTEIEY